MNLALGSYDLLVSMEERREFGLMVPAGVAGDEGVGLEDRFEPLVSIGGLVPDFGEVCEVSRDLTLMPGVQDRFDV